MYFAKDSNSQNINFSDGVNELCLTAEMDVFRIVEIHEFYQRIETDEFFQMVETHELFQMVETKALFQ